MSVVVAYHILLIPINNMFMEHEESEYINLIHTYFPKDLASNTISEITEYTPLWTNKSKTPTVYTIINYLLGEIIELSGYTARRNLIQTENKV